MDALAHLALMAKAKLVFEDSEDHQTFMSFPALAPIGYKADQLRLGVLDSVDNAERLVYSEFARITNSMPDDTIFEVGEQFLWDVYGEILRSATVATGSTTPEEDAAYQKARDFLGILDASGHPVAEPEVEAYQGLRGIWFNAVEAFKAQQLTATTTSDPAVVKQWHDVDQPRLRAAVEAARAEWETKGFKAEVEAAQKVEQAYEAHSPVLAWDAWSSQYDPDIDLTTDPAAQEFAATTFIPGDIFDQEWPTFRLTKDEIADLAAKAPEELKGIFAPEGSQSTVNEVSFEFRSVKVARHWFRPEVFSSRIWRLPANDQPLSDGAEPPAGRWPAYVAALVFARNIQVTMDAPQPEPPVRLVAIPALERDTPLVFNGRTKMRLKASPEFSLLRASMIEPAIRVAPIEPVAQPVIAPHVMFTARAARISDALIFRANTVDLGQVEPAPVPMPEPPPPPPPPTPPPDPRSDISILAFICKRLPKSPDPDPALTWPAATP